MAYHYNSVFVIQISLCCGAWIILQVVENKCWSTSDSVCACAWSTKLGAWTHAWQVCIHVCACSVHVCLSVQSFIVMVPQPAWSTADTQYGVNWVPSYNTLISGDVAIYLRRPFYFAVEVILTSVVDNIIGYCNFLCLILHTAGVVLVAIYGLGNAGWFDYIPQAALAAIIIPSVLLMFDWRTPWNIWKVRSEFV